MIGVDVQMTSREAVAVRFAELLNQGASILDACSRVGMVMYDLFSEDNSVLELDDPDNDLIDVGWDGDELVLLNRVNTGSDNSPWVAPVVQRNWIRWGKARGQ